MSFVELPKPVVHAIKQDSTIWLPWESLPKQCLGNCNLLPHSPWPDFSLLLPFCSASFARRQVLPQLCCELLLLEFEATPNLTTPRSKQAHAGATATPCSAKPRTGPSSPGRRESPGSNLGSSEVAFDCFRREPMIKQPSGRSGPVAHKRIIGTSEESASYLKFSSLLGGSGRCGIGLVRSFVQLLRLRRSFQLSVWLACPGFWLQGLGRHHRLWVLLRLGAARKPLVCGRRPFAVIARPSRNGICQRSPEFQPKPVAYVQDLLLNRCDPSKLGRFSGEPDITNSPCSVRLHCTSAAGKLPATASRQAQAKPVQARARPPPPRPTSRKPRARRAWCRRLEASEPARPGPPEDKPAIGKEQAVFRADRLIQITVASAHRSSASSARVAERICKPDEAAKGLQPIDAPRTAKVAVALADLIPGNFGPGARSKRRLCAGFRKAGAQQLLQSPLCLTDWGFRTP